MNHIFKKNYFVFLSVAFACIALFIVGCRDHSSLPMSQLLNEACKNAVEGNWQQSLSFADEAVKREPENVAALLIQALAYEHLEKYDLALQAARKAESYDSSSFQAQYTLGRLYAKSPDKLQDAIAPLLRAHNLNPKSEDTLVLLARCSAKLKLDSAIKYYEQLSKSSRFSNKPEVWNQLGILYALQNQQRPASICFVRAYNLAPTNHLVVLNFAIFLDHYLNKKERAVNFYRKYLELAERNPEEDERRNRIQQRIELLRNKTRNTL